VSLFSPIINQIYDVLKDDFPKISQPIFPEAQSYFISNQEIQKEEEPGLFIDEFSEIFVTRSNTSNEGTIDRFLDPPIGEKRSLDEMEGITRWKRNDKKVKKS
jgi:hypothetical protein